MDSKRMRAVATTALALTFATAYAATNIGNNSYLKIDGSNTIGAELAPTLAVAYLRANGASETSRTDIGDGATQVRGRTKDGQSHLIEIHAKGSGTAFKALADGRGDIGAASRPVKEIEWRALLPHGDLRTSQSEHVLGLDGIAVIVHPDNPLQSLTKEQVKAVFAGELTEWSGLGIEIGPIHVYTRDENSGTFDTFSALVMGKDTPMRPDVARFESNARLSDQVAADRSGIGFVGLSAVRNARALAIADGGAAVAPTQFSVATEDYPLSRRLFFYNFPDPENPVSQDFIDFALSKQGQKVLKDVGFVGQNLTTVGITPPDNAPSEYLKIAANAKRLSVNLRFKARSYRLDNKAKRDVERITDYMQQAENKRRQLILLGFTDPSEASGLATVALSENRAMAVDRLLRKQGLIPVSVRGLGSSLPVANSDSELGRTRNQRVEIWVR
jgi:phosphate transport system substrate-binding protein